jgi:hypothetical protein
MEKAAVFPDPVLALANMSFPSNASGMAFSCIGVGVPQPKVAIALKNKMKWFTWFNIKCFICKKKKPH